MNHTQSSTFNQQTSKRSPAGRVIQNQSALPPYGHHQFLPNTKNPGSNIAGFMNGKTTHQSSKIIQNTP